jgi:hypothetical protein
LICTTLMNVEARSLFACICSYLGSSDLITSTSPKQQASFDCRNGKFVEAHFGERIALRGFIFVVSTLQVLSLHQRGWSSFLSSDNSIFSDIRNRCSLLKPCSYCYRIETILICSGDWLIFRNINIYTNQCFCCFYGNRAAKRKFLGNSRKV